LLDRGNAICVGVAASARRHQTGWTGLVAKFIQQNKASSARSQNHLNRGSRGSRGTASLGQERVTMTLLSVFASIALLLAVVGIYGAVGYTVEQRTGEIGVRMALGAQTNDVLRLVIRQGMNPVLIGLVIGLAATFPMGYFLAAQLYEVSPHNPLLLGASAIALALAGFLACLIPARRATRVNPVVALRTE
jgi:ABC-type antimicrobial peptide transport system permease subunit